jgi:hypothetical protein
MVGLGHRHCKTQNCAFTGAAYYCIVKGKPCLYVVP